MAKGDWISFLGSDDIYLENALKKYAKNIDENKSADFIHSKVKLIKNGKTKHIFANKWNWSEFKRNMKIAHVGSFHNKNYFKTYGKYNEDYKIVGDYEMLLRAKNNLKTVFFDEFTAEMKDGGISNNYVFKAFSEAKKAKIKTANISKSIAFLDAYFSLLKYAISRLIK